MSVTRTNRRELLQKGALLAAGCLAGGPFALQAADSEQQADPAKIKITGVKTYLLQHKLKRRFGVSVSVPLDQFRKTLLVKVETDAGLTGWGETAPVGGARGTIDDQIGPRLIGQNPLEQRKLWRMMWGPNFGNALAVAALDMAINDIRGQALNLSVAELFGGRLRDRVPAYASAMNYVENEQPEEQYPREAEQLVKQGFKALKMRIGRYPVVREAAVAAAVREAVGLDIKLMADGNAAYTLSSALQMGEVLHDLNFEYFEEPLPQSPHYAGYEELRRKLALPLAAGEGVDSRGSAKELIDRQCMHIIQPDVSLCGGIGETLFISELAALSGIRCIPHCWGGAILIAATVQTLSLMPDPHWGFPTDTPMLELDQSENPWRTEIVKEPFQLKDGFVDVPTRPGLGIEVDEAIVKRYAI
ncbi:MAG: mandelate racemase/muconate lactonizing enzyme family protein [Planctomycetaceae bacterium]|nr:mandelate racemase/muconate lactonizing enzyme family protein [Planctomycetaceae bacterium]